MNQWTGHEPPVDVRRVSVELTLAELDLTINLLVPLRDERHRQGQLAEAAAIEELRRILLSAACVAATVDGPAEVA